MSKIDIAKEINDIVTDIQVGPLYAEDDALPIGVGFKLVLKSGQPLIFGTNNPEGIDEMIAALRKHQKEVWPHYSN